MPNIKSKIVRAVGPLGGFQVSRKLSQSIPKILMYHRFSNEEKIGFVHREVFDSQVKYLKKNFNLLTLDELVNAYKKKNIFPKNAVVITVDDGYCDFYDVAYPVLKKYNVPATFYISTRFVDGDFWLWPDTVKYILDNSDGIDMDNISGGLVYKEAVLNAKDRYSLWSMIISYLLSITEDKKKTWLTEFAKVQNIEIPKKPEKCYQAVSWDQVKELDKNMIEIGVHTQTHPSLGRLHESQLESEIQGSVDIIRQKTGAEAKNFCYPNGQPSDYSELVKKFVEDAGCHSAVTAFYDQYLVDDLFELRRFNVSTNWQYFLRSVNGVDALAAKWLKTNNIMTSSAQL